MNHVKKLTIRLANLESQLDQVLVENVEFRNIIHILRQEVTDLQRHISAAKADFSGRAWKEAELRLPRSKQYVHHCIHPNNITLKVPDSYKFDDDLQKGIKP